MDMMAKLRHHFIICYVNLRAAKVCGKYSGFDFEVAQVLALYPHPYPYPYPFGQD